MNKKSLLYYCVDCGKEIKWFSALYSFSLCRSCSGKRRITSKETRKKLSKAKIGNINSLGYHHSKETLAKIAKASIGRKLSKESKLKIAKAKLGIKRSKKTCLKISKTLKGKYLGKKHPCWMGGISFFPYGIKFNKELKLKIRKLNNFKCQICNKLEVDNGAHLSIHHIDYNKNHNNIKNLMCLCKSCHSKTNGNKELDRSYWYAYCTYLMENNNAR